MRKTLVVKKGNQNIFPNLLDEGKKYGLSATQLHQLERYLNDKRMLRLISFGKFSEDARAWLSALTGIVANILETDAHVNIWLNKKLEKPRNWILSKLNDVIPTKIDDITTKVIQTAEEFYDNKILPAKERVLSNINSKMHDKYNQHSNATYLGMNLKDLKQIAKDNLKESKNEADKDALKVLKQRKLQDHVLHGYFDEDGDFVNLDKYQSNDRFFQRRLTSSQFKGGNRGNAKQNNEITAFEGTTKEGSYP